ncbi:MAG: lactonase family protein [Lachnospiraceae bacterium]|nr:lactonase family protein [Lachnospiraceae bacterium]
MSEKERYVAYVGTYTHEKSIGIYVYDVDVEHGVLTQRSVAPINNPSYLCVSHDGERLYSIEDEGVAAFSIDENGDLTKLNSKWIGGMRGCYVEVDSKRRFLFVGGYHDGRVTVMRLNKDGSVGDIADGIFHQGMALSATERRIDHPKVSCVKLTPDEKFLLAADYGLNQIKVYRINYNTGKLTLEDIIRPELDASPRTIRFSKDAKFCYILMELSNEIEVYSYDIDEDGEPVFDKVQVIQTLPELNHMCASTNLGLSRDDKYMFVSVDGENTVSCFSRDAKTGKLTYRSETPGSGYFPKSISVLPGDEFYVVLNHDSNEMRAFKIFHKEKYALMKSRPIEINKPNCIRIHKLA